MKAALRDRYGPPQVVEVREVARPEPAGDQVLVRVRAASVNRADLDNLYPRWRFLRLFLGIRAPRNGRLGIDAAGVVEAVGPDVTRFRPGDQVFADLFVHGLGAFAEFVCAPEQAFATMPEGLSFEEAAALPHAAILALQGLRLRRGRTLKPGDRVLVVGASGSVGPFAIQIALARGAVVTGVARGDKLDLVRSLGAEAIDYTTVDYTAARAAYDWVLDVDAHHGLLRWRHVLRPGGVYLALGGPGGWFLRSAPAGPFVSLATGKTIGLMLWWKPFLASDVEELKRLVAAGQLKPVIDASYPLDDVAAALRRVDDGEARGKVVITM